MLVRTRSPAPRRALLLPELAAAAKAQWRQLVVGLAMVALLSMATLSAASVWLPFNPADRGGDIGRFWIASHSLLSGTHVFPYKPGFGPFFHPAPYIVLLLPLGLLTPSAAAAVAQVASAALLIAAVAAWGYDGVRVPGTAWLLVLSLPVVVTVYLGQLPTAIGLIAFTAAVWAQRRGNWWLVGVAVALGLIRPANAPPVIMMLVVSGWKNRRTLLTATLAGCAVLIPLIVVTTLWDRFWASDYISTLSEYPAGIETLLGRVYGPLGVVLLEAMACVIAIYWVRHDAGRPLDLDRAAAVLAMSVFVAPLTAAYAAIFAVPALIRLSARQGMAGISPLATIIPWLAAFWRGSGALGPDVLAPTLVGAIALASLPALLVRRATPRSAGNSQSTPIQ
jgi:hypothetical protein